MVGLLSEAKEKFQVGSGAMMDQLILIHKYVKQMRFKPRFGKPYDNYLYDKVQNLLKESMGYTTNEENRVWQLASFIAEKVEAKLNKPQ